MSDLERSQRRVRFTGEGWSFLAILAFVVVGSILRQINLLVLLAAMMIPALLFNWRMALALLRRVVVHHEIREWTFAGQSSVIELEVVNQSRTFTAWNIMIRDTIRRILPIGGAAESHPIDLVAVAVEPEHAFHLSYRCFFTERGVYQLGPIQVACEYPFGLVRGSFQQLDAVQLHVAPRRGVLKPTWNRRLGALAVGMASAKRRRGWLPDEFYGLRQWQHGDSTRWIHWRSTAKRGNLMVKQFDQPTDRDFALLLDLFIPDAPGAADRDRVELAASFVCTMLAELNLAVQGRIAIAVCGDRSTLFSNQVPGEFVSSVMQELAVTQPGRQIDIGAMLEELVGKVSVGTPLIVVTTRDQAQIQELTERSEWPGHFQGDAGLLWIPVESDDFREIFTPPGSWDVDDMPLHNAAVIAELSEE